MAFCNLFVNLNFRLPHINTCGCSMPFNSGINFSPMQNLFGFSAGFGCCNNGFWGGFGGFFNSMPFFGLNNYNNNIFSFYNQPTSSFVGNFNPIQNLPSWSPPSGTSLWNQASLNTSHTSSVSWGNTSSWNTMPSWNNTPERVTKTSENSSNSKTTTTTYSKNVNGSIDNSYASLSKTEAEKKAQNDSRLEKLSGGKNWSLASTFETDIPYAKQGTSAILSKVSNMVGENLIITSALGTGGTSKEKSPHQIGGYTSHHNAENPKLDIDITSRDHGERLAQKLRETGYFSHISIESDHLDVQIDPSKYERVSIVA